jgi:hypothetical protein
LAQREISFEETRIDFDKETVDAVLKSVARQKRAIVTVWPKSRRTIRS